MTLNAHSSAMIFTILFILPLNTLFLNILYLFGLG